MLGHFSLDNSGSSDSDTPETQNEVEIELTNYRKVSSLPKNKNPVLLGGKIQYPLLAKLAKKYLCIQATSTTAERVLSKLGLLLTKRRLCLDGERSDSIMFLSDKL